jgi:glycosyl hydrolase family 106( putative alpha-L-rhamnosidase)
VDIDTEFASSFTGGSPATGAMFRWHWPNAAVDHCVDPHEYGYGSPRWIAALEAVFEAAVRRGLQVDLTLGAHWPLAVPGLDVDGPGTTKELTYAYTVVTGGTFAGSVPAPAPRTYPDRTIENGTVVTTTRTSTPALVAVGAVRCLDLTGETPLLDLGSAIDLTGSVVDGAVRWTPPDDAPWVLAGYWSRGTGIRNDLPFGNLPSLYTDPEARAIDYFSRDGVVAFTSYFETTLSPRALALMRRVGGAVFDDSIEATVGAARLWTPRLLDEFEKRRGYRLTAYLPVLAADARSGFGDPPPPVFRFAGDGAAASDRVLRDLDQTYHELYLDEHVRPMVEWAHSLGLEYRAQPYGLPIDIAEAATLLDVPECETLACGAGDDWRLVSAGADVAGTTIVSDELIPGLNGPLTDPVWAGPYEVTPPETVRQVNQQYALGAKQMVFHGLAYPHWPPSLDGTVHDDHTGWPGFHEFATLFPEPFGRRQPAWGMTGDVARYYARTQRVLQTGRRRTDLAVYNQSIGHITGAVDAAALLAAGYTYAYLTPGLLDDRGDDVEDGVLLPAGPAFRAMVVADQASMPLRAARALHDLAAAGLPVFVVGDPPSRTPGYAATPAAAAAEDRKLREVVAAILAAPGVHRVADTGRLPAALAAHGIRPAAWSTVDSVRTVRRVSGGVDWYYVHNDSAGPVSATVSLTAPGVPHVLDAWTGAIGQAARYTAADGVVAVDLDLAAGGSALVALVPSGHRLPHVTATTADRVLRHAGRLVVRASRPGEYRTTLHDGAEVVTSVPALPPPVELSTWDLTVDDWQPAQPGGRSSDTTHVEWTFPAIPLQPWRELPGLADAVGVGRYATVVHLPPEWAHASGGYLSLGTVAGAFRVSVDGVDVGVVDQLSCRVDLGHDVLRRGKVTVEVTVATTLINRVRTTQPAFAAKARQDVGLLGPVTLIPYADRALPGR